MEELIVTRFWMGGVVGMMLIFAVIALVGIYKQKKNNKSD